jgi:phosphoribosylaminoimidazole carboxylase (NCAIR synthetase)
MTARGSSCCATRAHRCRLGRAIGGRLDLREISGFSREVSIIGARSAAGKSVFYPLSANTHAGGILRYSTAPFVNPKLERSQKSTCGES